MKVESEVTCKAFICIGRYVVSLLWCIIDLKSFMCLTAFLTNIVVGVNLQFLPNVTHSKSLLCALYILQILRCRDVIVFQFVYFIVLCCIYIPEVLKFRNLPHKLVILP